MLPDMSDPFVRYRKQGYLAALLGALAGAVGGGVSVGGMAFVFMKCESAGLECLGVALLAAAIGVVAALSASVGGCYWTLRWRGYDRAGRTAAFMAALLPVAAFVSVALAGLLTIFGPVIGIAGAAVGARRLAVGKPRVGSPSTVIETKGTV